MIIQITADLALTLGPNQLHNDLLNIWKRFGCQSFE